MDKINSAMSLVVLLEMHIHLKSFPGLQEWDIQVHYSRCPISNCLYETVLIWFIVLQLKKKTSELKELLK